jgi:hypothetical protein
MNGSRDIQRAERRKGARVHTNEMLERLTRHDRNQLTNALSHVEALMRFAGSAAWTSDPDTLRSELARLEAESDAHTAEFFRAARVMLQRQWLDGA